MICVDSRYWTLKTWDRFKIPKPVSTVHIFYDTPFTIPANLSANQFQNELENMRETLTRLNDRASAFLASYQRDLESIGSQNRTGQGA